MPRETSDTRPFVSLTPGRVLNPTVPRLRVRTTSVASEFESSKSKEHSFYPRPDIGFSTKTQCRLGAHGPNLSDLFRWVRPEGSMTFQSKAPGSFGTDTSPRLTHVHVRLRWVTVCVLFCVGFSGPSPRTVFGGRKRSQRTVSSTSTRTSM